ncbi:glycosyl hydrolase [Haloferula chungangensis]|uniref:beta-fructofuranosidase n=1 Tax=Haloferula chungangensis TaxID=1048331 RepID=A0ABW2L7A1_9BACT
MFAETEESRKAIGDVDVLYHDGLYHLFHLVLPNHDFIAHAVSTDGVNWRRVRNALFIGDPGSWDDLMLWTMHVSPDPHHPGHWRMFYTGLSRRERGRLQRIGLATSDDLYRWRKHAVNWEDNRGPHDPPKVKESRELSQRSTGDVAASEVDPHSCYPLAPDSAHYESEISEGRGMISFRDPYFFSCPSGNWLLAAARVKSGPLVRRGCVAVMKEVEPNHFVGQAPLHHPMLYDDIEVPNVFELGGQIYLIGSIREDAKIRYWHTDTISKPWQSYHDNVLMPQGNYAGRVCRDEKGLLLWCFFAMNRDDRTANNLMPPPKRLIQDANGLLRVKRFEVFDEWLDGRVDTCNIRNLKPDETGNYCRAEEAHWMLESKFGFQAFVFEEELQSFRLDCRMKLIGKGKCGFVFRIDPESHDGYYLSLDLLKGVAQMRAWGTNRDKSGEHMMNFETVQSAFWQCESPGEAEISILAFGSYLEVSIDGYIILSMADQHFDHGYVGPYLETAELEINDLKVWRLKNPTQQDDQLVGG